jgi:hypothetical protein
LHRKKSGFRKYIELTSLEENEQQLERQRLLWREQKKSCENEKINVCHLKVCFFLLILPYNMSAHDFSTGEIDLSQVKGTWMHQQIF